MSPPLLSLAPRWMLIQLMKVFTKCCYPSFLYQPSWHIRNDHLRKVTHLTWSLLLSDKEHMGHKLSPCILSAEAATFPSFKRPQVASLLSFAVERFSLKWYCFHDYFCLWTALFLIEFILKQSTHTNIWVFLTASLRATN